MSTVEQHKTRTSVACEALDGATTLSRAATSSVAATANEAAASITTNRVVLFPTYEQALAYRKRLALATPAASFGVTVTTPLNWLEDTWKVWGNGQALMSNTQRLFAVRCALERTSEFAAEFAVDALTPGMTVFVARLFQKVFGTQEFEAAVANTLACLAPREQALMRVAVRYGKLIAQKGLVEEGTALAYLAQHAPLPQFELGCYFEPSFAFAYFLRQVCPKALDVLEQQVQITATSPSVHPRFLYAAGPSCEHALIEQELSEAAAAQPPEVPFTALLATQQPYEAYEALAMPLAAKGITTTVRASKPFAQTEFGRAWYAITQFLCCEAGDMHFVRNFVANSFSGITTARAHEIDIMIRGNRLFSVEDAVLLLRSESPTFEYFEELATDVDASLLLDYFEDIAETLPGKDAAYRAEQINAVQALRRVYEQARAWNADVLDCLVIAQQETVTASYTMPAQTNSHTAATSTAGNACLGEVTIVAYEKSLDACVTSYSEVVVCDLDSRFHLATTKTTAETTLLNKLGLVAHDTTLARQRVRFETLKAAATHTFACERVLEGGDEEKMYSSFILDEFVEACAAADKVCVEQKAQPGENKSPAPGPNQKPAVNTYDLPACLAPFMRTRGEELLAANSIIGSPVAAVGLDACNPHELSTSVMPYVFPTGSHQRYHDELVLSPSAIEAYINCPAYWFATRRLCPQSPDEQFSPLEQGTFVHSVFEAFYARVAEALPEGRVTSTNMPQALFLLDAVYEQTLSEQSALKPPRYVPVTPTEQTEANKLHRALQENIRLQAGILDGYVPCSHEFIITPQHDITYAGVRLQGRIDRIDFNAETGGFVVLDYKGSVQGHEAGVKEGELPQLPHKIQALIYATAIRRLLSSNAQTVSHTVAPTSTPTPTSTSTSAPASALVSGALQPQVAGPSGLSDSAQASTSAPGTQQPLQTSVLVLPANAHAQGALYVSYKAKQEQDLLAGSYAETLEGVQRYSRKASAVHMNFDAYLDAIEALIEPRLERMKQGCIEPDPLVEQSCRYCKVQGCARRLS